jgi:hypothetical protein
MCEGKNGAVAGGWRLVAGSRRLQLRGIAAGMVRAHPGNLRKSGIAVVTVRESQIEPLTSTEVLSVRALQSAV